MVSLAVICASPPGSNPGMHSVDLAMHCLKQQLDASTKVRYYVLYEPGSQAQPNPDLQQQAGLDFCYEPMIGRLDELYASDIILYWGDFLHAYRYRQTVMEILQQRRIAWGSRQAADLVDQYLFLRDADPAVLKRTLLFGQTLIFNRQCDYADVGYSRSMYRLFRGVRRVWMRDVYSAMKVARIRQSFRHSHLGVDCAMLLRDEDVDKLPTTTWLTQRAHCPARVGIYFGRSSNNIPQLGTFARQLCQELDVQAEWLPWGNQSAFDDLLKPIRRQFKTMHCPDPHAAPTLGDLLRRLGTYRLIITDTYHLCLNAWRMGVPAICVGPAVNRNAWSVSSGKAFAWRDKRQVLYAMYDAMDYYVLAEELADRAWRKRRIFHLTRLLAGRGVAACITQQMHQHRDAVAKSLLAELRGRSADKATITQPKQSTRRLAVQSEM